ncbi:MULTISPECIES: IS607 family transposase [Brevibacillus]|uniref:IS607 family transposase n=1 Tax=Brevibacillus brevis TaxID=1393 RepID=A0A2Z4MC47_BREBE|nr:MULTISPECIES: IS607 family transposase [Brevibacillus]AWX53999.1 IS607 family transposase [Brevibacillus brevis]NRR21684.1 IS607 family transposase [Brevibacillus sp. MS2.2]
MYAIGKFAKMIGVTPKTLREWDKSGKLTPILVKENGYRYYSDEQLYEYLRRPAVEQERITIGYCRVSSNKQKDDLERQVDNVKSYMIARGYSFDVITDIGSGINYEKRGLLQLMDFIIQGKVDRVVVLDKDRLLSFGFELFENLCKRFSVVVEIIDNSEKTEEQELVEDLIQIVTVFSCRLPGKRANTAKKMIKELAENDSSEES